MIKLNLNGKFDLIDLETNERFNSTVPGDINYDMYINKNLPHYYIDENYKSYKFAEKDFIYEKKFNVSKEMIKYESVNIIFYGIDTYSEIYLNGNLVGNTDNAFISYKFSIKDFIVEGDNILQVKMLSTMERYNNANNDYKVLFGKNRLFIRRPQCHFGWDWAPELVAYGIYRDVEIVFDNGKRIGDISYHSENDGNIRVFARLENDYAWNAFDDGDEILYEIYDGQQKVVQTTKKVNEVKNFVNLFVPNVKLWWPNGYGEQNLYNLKVTLLSNGDAIDSQVFNFGFRNIKVCNEPIDEDNCSFYFEVNGVKIYGKGSNWVPIDCLTGTITDEKYDKAVFLAKEANMNMLRVWGGGLYESDCFYNACDKYGIMVWQDCMIACSEIPQDNVEFEKTLIKELEDNVVRLRNHPSLLCFTGGNERIKSDKCKNSKYSRVEEFYLRGVANALAPDIPYFYQSPQGYLSSDNEITSGDCHKSVYDCITTENIENARGIITAFETNFNSECTSLGPTIEKTYKKMFTDCNPCKDRDKWIDRHSRNPYAKVDIPFFDKIVLFSEKVYGKISSISDFCIKGMDVHAEFLRLETDYRRMSKRNNGMMNWMFSDIWPTGNWSLVDYYLERKSVYYTAKRSFEPLTPVIAYTVEKVTQFAISNHTKEKVIVELIYGERYYDGVDVWTKTVSGLELEPLTDIVIDKVNLKNGKETYCFVEMKVGEIKKEVLYTPYIWAVPTSKPQYSYKIESAIHRDGEIITPIKIKSKNYVKSIFIDYIDDDYIIFNDNYFDMQANSEKMVYITSDKPLNIDKIKISSFKEVY